jgi:hypothetical protein
MRKYRCLSLHIFINIHMHTLTHIYTLIHTHTYTRALIYILGQRYTAHHDADQADTALACGPRILTFFLYLSDVEEGGETNFPMLNISVTPKKVFICFIFMLYLLLMPSAGLHFCVGLDFVTPPL